MPADMEMMESIRRVEEDIRESRSRVKDMREELATAVKVLPEATDLADALSDARIAREKLKKAAAEDMDCRSARDALEAETSKLKDLREILSHHLVRYRETSQATYIEEEESKKVRPILLTAKLGKPEYHQEELFAEAKDAHA